MVKAYIYIYLFIYQIYIGYIFLIACIEEIKKTAKVVIEKQSFFFFLWLEFKMKQLVSSHWS